MANQFLDLLKKEHKEVKSIFEQIQKGSQGDREKLFMQLKKELQPHLKGEEKAFYPILLEKKDVREDTFESMEEHHVTELVLKELDRMSHSDERWAAKLNVLKELVEHHIQEEEQTLFKLAQKNLDDEQFQSILEKFQKEKERVKESLK